MSSIDFTGILIIHRSAVYLSIMSRVYSVDYIQEKFTACFEVQSGAFSPSSFLGGARCDLSRTAGEHTLHGNEVRVMVRPEAKRTAWNTKRGTPWKS